MRDVHPAHTFHHPRSSTTTRNPLLPTVRFSARIVPPCS